MVHRRHLRHGRQPLRQIADEGKADPQHLFEGFVQDFRLDHAVQLGELLSLVERFAHGAVVGREVRLEAALVREGFEGGVQRGKMSCAVVPIRRSQPYCVP